MKTSDWKHASDLSHEEWRERLQAYIRLGDRDVEPVFVGRQQLFAEVEEPHNPCHERPQVRQSDHRDRRRSGCGQVCIRGRVHPPSQGQRQGRFQLSLNPKTCDQVSLVKALATALGMKLAEQTHRSKGVSAFGRIFGVGVGAAKDRRPPSIRRCCKRRKASRPCRGRRSAKTFGEKQGGRPILLFVDEAQTFRKQQTLHDFIPKRLHKGAPENSVPIIPVYTGLADTGMKLHTEAGLTREVARNAFALGGLSPDESREYARDVIRDYFGMEADADQAANLYDWMVEEGSGWPQHLRTQLEAVAECLLAANSRMLSALDPERLRQTVEHSREEYYGKRATRVEYDRFRDVARTLVMETAARDGCDWPTLEEIAHNALDGRRHAPDSKTYIEEMVHAGLLAAAARRHWALRMPHTQHEKMDRNRPSCHSAHPIWGRKGADALTLVTDRLCGAHSLPREAGLVAKWIIGGGVLLAILVIAGLTARKSVRAEIVINASPEDVWSVLTDPQTYGEWNPIFVAYEGRVCRRQQTWASDEDR